MHVPFKVWLRSNDAWSSNNRLQPIPLRLVLLTLWTIASPIGFSQIHSEDGFAPRVDGPVWAMAVQTNGQILVGGNFDSMTDSPQLNLSWRSATNIGRFFADGTMDTNFNPRAVYETNVSLSAVNVLAVQKSDGKILVGGFFTKLAGGNRNYLGRLNSNGTLDSGFNTTPIPFNGEVLCLAVQPDGKILVGGSFTLPDINIVRLNANGTVDPAFQSPLTPDQNFSVSALALQPDGKILVGGLFSILGANPRDNLARLRPDGGVDPTFNADTDDEVLALAVQEDGRIVVGGFFTTLGGVRQANLGQLDPDGIVNLAFPTANNFVYSLAIQCDGRILVGGGFTMLGAAARNRICRLNANGALDGTFNPGADNLIYSLAVQQDDKILVGGSFVTLGGQTRQRVGRLYADGRLDATLKLPRTDAANIGVYSVATQPDGKLLAGGLFAKYLGNHGLGRLNTDGSVDTTFAVGPNNEGANNIVYSLAVQASGHILVGGDFLALGGLPRNNFGRLTPAGAVDANFTNGANDKVLSLLVQTNGQILLGGTFTALGVPPISSSPHNRIGRLNPDGTVDATFTVGADADVYSLALQADGKILVGGAFNNLAGSPRVKLGRLLPGPPVTLDTGFAPAVTGAAVYCLAVQRDGKILAGGSFNNLAGSARLNIGRLNASGSLDTFNPGANGPVYSLAVQLDGKILVGGLFTSLAGSACTNIGRLNTNGTLDTTFTNMMADGPVYGLAVQSDAKIMVGGEFSRLGGEARSMIGRLTGGRTGLQQSLGITMTRNPATITWLRGGAGPEIEQVSFEHSLTGAAFTVLGFGSRIPGGWQLADGLPLPAAGQFSFYLRARGRTAGGQHDGSSGLIEHVCQFYWPVPVITSVDRDGTASVSVSYTNTLPGWNYVLQYNTNLSVTDWRNVGTKTATGTSDFQTDIPPANGPQRYYRVALSP